VKVGRKPQVRHLKKATWIYAACENLFRAIATKKALERADAHARLRAAETEIGTETIINLNSDALTKLREVQHDLQAVPVEERRKKKGDIQELRREAHRFQKAIRGRKKPKHGFENSLSGKVTRPKGYRQKICQAVAAKASRHFKWQISASKVEKCWKWGRKYLLGR